jgi:group I intron endonuclease
VDNNVKHFQMKYTIYRIINKLNGKIYIGKHQTNDVNDNYMGSGRAIKTAIKRHGSNNFSKEILFVYDSEKEMNDKEKELVTELFISDPDTYNLGIGGEGGPHFNGLRHSEETRKNLSEKQQGKKHTLETRKKISEGNRKRKISEETKKKLSDRSKERWSDSSKRKEHSELMKNYYKPQ